MGHTTSVSEYVIDAGGQTVTSSNISSILDTIRGQRLVLMNASSVVLEALDFTGVALTINTTGRVLLDGLSFSGVYLGSVLSFSSVFELDMRNSLFSQVEWSTGDSTNRLLRTSSVEQIMLLNNTVRDMSSVPFGPLFEILKGSELVVKQNTLSSITEVDSDTAFLGYNLFLVWSNSSSFRDNVFRDIGDGNIDLKFSSILISVRGERFEFSQNTFERIKVGGSLYLVESSVAVSVIEHNVIRNLLLGSGTLFSVGRDRDFMDVTITNNTVQNIRAAKSTYPSITIFRIFHFLDVSAKSLVSVTNNSLSDVDLNINTYEDQRVVLTGRLSFFVLNTDLNSTVAEISNNSITSVLVGLFIGIEISRLGSTVQSSIIRNTISDIKSNEFIGFIASGESRIIENNISATGSRNPNLTGITFIADNASTIQGNKIELLSDYLDGSSTGILIYLTNSSLEIVNNSIRAETDIHVSGRFNTTAIISIVNNILVGDMMILAEISDNIVCENNTFNGRKVGCLVGSYDFPFGFPVRSSDLKQIQKYGTILLIIGGIAILTYKVKKMRRQKEIERIRRYESKYSK